MVTEFKIIESRLTAYQLSKALGISVDMATDLLDEKLKIKDLDAEVIEKVENLEEALFEQ